MKFGQYTIDPPPGILRGDLSTLISFATSLIQLILIFSVVAATLFILIGAVKWIISGGDKQALAGAKSTVTYAIIGLVLAFISFAILGLFSTFFNINLGTGK